MGDYNDLVTTAKEEKANSADGFSGATFAQLEGDFRMAAAKLGDPTQYLALNEQFGKMKHEKGDKYLQSARALFDINPTGAAQQIEAFSALHFPGTKTKVTPTADGLMVYSRGEDGKPVNGFVLNSDNVDKFINAYGMSTKDYANWKIDADYKENATRIDAKKALAQIARDNAQQTKFEFEAKSAQIAAAIDEATAPAEVQRILAESETAGFNRDAAALDVDEKENEKWKRRSEAVNLTTDAIFSPWTGMDADANSGEGGRFDDDDGMNPLPPQRSGPGFEVDPVTGQSMMNANTQRAARVLSGFLIDGNDTLKDKMTPEEMGLAINLAMFDTRADFRFVDGEQSGPGVMINTDFYPLTPGGAFQMKRIIMPMRKSLLAQEGNDPSKYAYDEDSGFRSTLTAVESGIEAQQATPEIGAGPVTEASAIPEGAENTRAFDPAMNPPVMEATQPDPTSLTPQAASAAIPEQPYTPSPDNVPTRSAPAMPGVGQDTPPVTPQAEEKAAQDFAQLLKSDPIFRERAVQEVVKTLPDIQSYQRVLPLLQQMAGKTMAANGPELGRILQRIKLEIAKSG